jgi:hypothetical protein
VPRPSLIVNSIPKSGTYLVALFLRNLGLKDSGLNFRDDRFWDFSGKPMSEIIAAPHRFETVERFATAIDRLRPGKFATAHLFHLPDNVRLLAERERRSVFLIRDLRHCLISHMRFVSDPRRIQAPRPWVATPDSGRRFAAYLKTRGAPYFAMMRQQIGWIGADVSVVRFEALLGDYGLQPKREAVRVLLKAGGVEGLALEDACALLDRSLSQPTRTYSGARSRLEDYLDGDVRDLMRQLGIDDANAELGYPPDAGPVDHG